MPLVVATNTSFNTIEVGGVFWPPRARVSRVIEDDYVNDILFHPALEAMVLTVPDGAESEE
jgi:hypothetical protein